MRYALLIIVSCWLLAGYVLACGSPPRTAEQEVAFQDSIAAIRTHREFQAMQAVEAERARRTLSSERVSGSLPRVGGQACLPSVHGTNGGGAAWSPSPRIP